MNNEAEAVHLFDLVRLVNDPQLPVYSTAGIQRINHLVTQFLHELQDIGDEAATDYVVRLCREVDADFNGLRETLTDKLRVLDVIQELRSADDEDQAKILAAMKLQFDRVEAKLDVMADDSAASARAAKKKIDPKGYYSYAEAVEAVGVSESTLRRQVRQKKLRTVNVGGRVKFIGNDLLVYQREREGGIRVLGD
jgi:excisionase family DNA binding protein